VPHLSPALLFERLTSDTNGRAVEYVHSIYRGDRYRIVTRLTLGGSSAGDEQATRTESIPGIPPGAFPQQEAVVLTAQGDVHADR
jgi:GntR family transcriptional regulator